MWRLSRIRYKAGRAGFSLEEFRLKRREHEKALRRARRDRELVSKRLLLNEDDGQQETIMDTCSDEKDVVSLLHKIQHSGLEREAQLKTLSKSLRDPASQLVFIKQENSVHMLIGLLTGTNTLCRLQSVHCLHELSHSPHPSVAPACLPATPYLLTYLSGQSTRFTELCLYTLGNLCPDSDVVREKLLAQGIIPALASCIENQRHNMAVVEAVGFTLSQLLQTKEASGKIIPLVLASSLPSNLLAVLTPNQNFSLGPAIECAWCLHYLTCSHVIVNKDVTLLCCCLLQSGEDLQALLACGALLQCSMLLVSLGDTVVQGNKEEGLELLICPLLRCVGNLLSCYTPDEVSACLSDEGLVAALCALLQAYVQSRPALARESAWVLNNLTARSSLFCSALMSLNLVPSLIHLLPFCQGINTMILRVLANVAHKKREFCIQLAELGLLSSLSATLKMAAQEVVILSLDILFMLLASDSQVVEDFVKQGGNSLLETLHYCSEGDVRRRAAYLLEHHLLSSSSYSGNCIPHS
ncbi:transmembrane and coiled-coil domain-containing protein 6 isoform X1 [Phyllopteryx taeniolatus]|uniref:transmembrane and coiled-coil domain-containing protein 6 isoform X1 n=2 Tax=Phyllopteryx taeniolatus TaxID=161469 RepID=UPI002AD40AF0|nr:transmembrane and coiled-coil domain-containing protein 6 isoform X1 [Phyllopteryx taeniolatus]